MQAFIDGAKDFAVSYVQSNFAQFATGSYYADYFSRYFSVAGFFIGFLLVLMVFFAGDYTVSKTSFVRVLAVMALTNSAYRPLYMLWEFLNPASSVGPAKYYGNYLSYQMDNVIAAFILLLVVFSSYKLSPGRAFLLGAVTCLSPLMLNYQYYYYAGAGFLIIRLVFAVLTGLLCVLVALRMYFYTSWMLYAAVHTLGLGLASVLDELITGGRLTADAFSDAFANIWRHVSYDWLSVALYTLILVFAVIFERVVMNPSASWATP